MTFDGGDERPLTLARDADEASRRLAETRDRVSKSFAENGAGIDANTEAGRKNADAIQAQIDWHARRLARCGDSLRLLNPQQVLDRGFAMLQDETGRVLMQRANFHAGQAVTATVRDGQVPLTVRTSS